MLAPVVNLRVGIHLVQDLPAVPVFPLFRGDHPDPFLQGGQDDQCDEIDEEPASHHLLGVDPQPGAINDVLHVVEQQFDLISLPVGAF